MNGLLGIPLGIVIALVTFGGLKLSIRSLSRRPQGASWLLVSSGLRIGLAAAAFAGLARAGAGTLFAGLTGFMIARGVLLYAGGCHER